MMPGGRGECGARGRGFIIPAPGRLGHHACRHYDRRARCIAATGPRAGGGNPPLIGAVTREAWPELSLRDARVPLARPVVERRKASARRFARAATQVAEDDTQRLSAFRFLFVLYGPGMIVMEAGCHQPAKSDGDCAWRKRASGEWRVANSE